MNLLEAMEKAHETGKKYVGMVYYDNGEPMWQSNFKELKHTEFTEENGKIEDIKSKLEELYALVRELEEELEGIK